ncbi:thiopeptide-type bacteriocin biosynthesis protein [Chryseobacterium sp. GVT01B]|uniref:thiopeptide-type bacteriocin biosynthesis protein n=1 Tax=Chryseobacterium sp. GVT01B TaxID=2862675 RepID=UPI001CC05055|nr:thiopeptide-type bacteriocin biosynthesis protein [Chryseobacterium sp. GVT01B]
MTERKFIPGSEWLYLKIYTGIKTSDSILEEVIQPLLDYFMESNYIMKWFFIRYNDPKPHLRLRLKLNTIENYNTILEKINYSFQPYVDSGEISLVAIETYIREIERYGQNTIEDAETLFHRNSEFTLQCLHYDDEEKIIVSFFYIDQLLNKLNLSFQKKLDWIKDSNDAFKKEFNADKKLNSQLDKKYRGFKPKFLDFLTSEDFLEERSAVLFNIEKCSSILKNILNYNEDQVLEMSLRTFFQSIFHMNINRMFVSNQRLFEMVIYDYLLRYYKMEAFKNL